MSALTPEDPAPKAPFPQPQRRTRRWFLRSLLGLGTLAVAGKGIDCLLPRTICRPGEWHGPRTDHFDGMYFHNIAEPAPSADYGSAPILRWLKDRLHRSVYPDVKRNVHVPQLAERVTGRDWEVTMINHSTMLVRLADYTILTDPVWSDYTSPIQGIGPRRTRPPGIAWENLPHIDICLLSHDHYDHFDADTLRLLEQRDHPLFILPLGLRSLLEYHTSSSVRVAEKDWWESVQLPRLTVHLTPARHWSKRYRTAETANRSLWCGFYLTAHNGPRLYFAGDSARTKWFARIRERLGAPDIALLPIGAYKPDWIRAHHTGPADAVDALLDLRAKQGIACHFGTWQLANDGYEETLADLKSALEQRNVPPQRFIAPDNGQTLSDRIPASVPRA